MINNNEYLPEEKRLIEALYGKTIQEFKPLGVGNRGSVSLIVFSDGEKRCYKKDMSSTRLEKETIMYSEVEDQTPSQEIRDDQNELLGSVIPFLGKVLKDEDFYGLSEKDQIELYLKMVKAVEKVHSKGILHRDLKVDNFTIDEDGVVHVIDFGRSVYEDARDTISLYEKDANFLQNGFRTVQLIPQPQVAPEYIFDESKVGFKSDVFALGGIGKKIFSSNPQMSEIYGPCLEVDPNDRPALSDLKESLEDRLEKLEEKRTTFLVRQVNDLSRICQDYSATLIRHKIELANKQVGLDIESPRFKSLQERIDDITIALRVVDKLEIELTKEAPLEDKRKNFFDVLKARDNTNNLNPRHISKESEAGEENQEKTNREKLEAAPGGKSFWRAIKEFFGISEKKPNANAFLNNLANAGLSMEEREANRQQEIESFTQRIR